MTEKKPHGLYFLLISVHGLLRGRDLELGRDADTGGQIKYVVELARALARHREVERVDLLTRQVVDPKVSDDYARPVEPLADNAFIIRLPCGPRRYLRKEVLWPHLDSLADRALTHIREVGRVPDIIHSHYADAGYVGARLAGLLAVPLIHTGHSLGREKHRRLLDRNAKSHVIERHYNMSRRIEAEEWAMDSASLVVASTRQEVERQYSLYDNYHPKRMRVIPPGTDLSRFRPPGEADDYTGLRGELKRFLTQLKRPMILALSRADERKNIQTLVRAFGEHPELQDKANLVIVAGNRDDITALDRGARKVLTDLLLLIDKYDLYGSVAYPKHHAADEVPLFYRMAAAGRGVFVNPALTEPFGLTLVEAAASGLPVVATEDGGPRDIIHHCRNGLLVDPLDHRAMGRAIHDALSNGRRWRSWSKNGIRGAHRHYSWDSHVESYLREVERMLGSRPRARVVRTTQKSRLPTVDRLLVADLDDTLLGDREAMEELLDRLGRTGGHVGFGITTGRPLKTALKTLGQWGVPLPDLIIAAVGSEIYYGQQLTPDRSWERHIEYRWDRERIRQALRGTPGLRLQAREGQRERKLSYDINPDRAPKIRDIIKYLRGLDLHANVIYSHGMFLDLLPIRAGKGQALRYLAAKWGIPPERVLVAGDSGNDIDALRGDTLGVVVGNYSHELNKLKGEPLIYFAEGNYAQGVLEGIDYYDFFGKITLPVADETP